MLPISRILFPVDFSESCTEMIPYIKLIAAKYKAEITLLNVVDPLIRIPDTGVAPAALLPQPRWVISQEAEKLESFGKEELDGFPVRRLVYEGDPEMQIVATAQGEKSQLVVMPTHGYGRFRRFLIGSTTSKVLHDLDCPVLTGAHHRRLNREIKIKNVVCALDLGPRSCDVLTWATRVCGDFQAHLNVVHVIPGLPPSLKIVFSPDVRDELEDSIRGEIERLRTTAGAQDVSVCVEEGHVARSICSYVKSFSADLLVIGRADRSADSGRLRENAYAIIRESACPVLSV